MKKETAIYILLLTQLTMGCSKAEFPESASEKHSISISAEIGSTNQNSLRYAGEVGQSQFAENDAIGLFQNDDLIPVKWTYDGSDWKADKTMYWKDKTQIQTFKAFYPYANAENQTAVPMPDLSNQSGKLTDIGKYDFLVAVKEQNLNDGSTVHFSGQHSFKHVSSLIKLTILGTQDLSSATLNSVKLKGENIVSASSYNFNNSNKVVFSNTVSEVEVGKAHVMGSANVEFYVIIHAQDYSQNEGVSLEISYTNNKKDYVATLPKFLANSLQGGKQVTATLNIKENEIVISNNSISPWDTEGGELGDIIIGGHENEGTPSV